MPVMRPKLPSTRQLVPYLRAIEERRSYSNSGPLCQKLESELSRQLHCQQEMVITAASATAGITAALLALDLPPDSICLMPSWTFVATPHAALAAGMKPFFMDVDRHSWALDPSEVRRALADGLCAPQAIMVVSPFGAPLDVTAWQKLQQETGIPIIVDAAAGFDTVRFSSLISVVSLHATKILAAGEGGFVVTPTSELRDRLKSCSNFGFLGSRVAQCRAVNSKMSEYHAAVALASLEAWPATRLRHLQIASWYRKGLAHVPGVALQPGYGEGWACGTTNVLLEGDSAESIGRYLLREGVETRMWWGTGCHLQPAFSACSRGKLPQTEFLAAHTLGLPHFPDMEKADVDLVCRVLGKALRSRASGRRNS
jgi:dTDP-4-amino-4,6-dideoxygalactose transaminase